MEYTHTYIILFFRLRSKQHVREFIELFSDTARYGRRW